MSNANSRGRMLVAAVVVAALLLAGVLAGWAFRDAIVKRIRGPQPTGDMADVVGTSVARFPAEAVPDPAPERAALYGMDTHDFMVARARSQHLGEPPESWQAGPFGGFDAVALDPPSQTVFADRMAAARRLATALQRQRIVSGASPVLVATELNFGREPVGEMLIPVEGVAAVQPPLRLVKIPALRVFASAPEPLDRMDMGQHSEIVTRLARSGNAMASPLTLYLRFESARPWEDTPVKARVLIPVR